MTNNMTMEQRKALVAELAARFKRDEAAYKAATFNGHTTSCLFRPAWLQ